MVSAGEKYEDQRWPLLHLFVLNLCCVELNLIVLGFVFGVWF